MRPDRFARALLLLLAFFSLPGTGAAHENTLPDVFHQVSGSVVEIVTQGRDISTLGPDRPVNVGGLGSGVLISEDGRVLTASHVVQTAEIIAVQFQDGMTVRARVLSSLPAADMAMLKLESVPAGAQVATLGDSSSVRVGDLTFVVGAPLGASHTLTVGHISARRSSDTMIGSLEGMELFQTDAAINPGNSGGPLFNMSGEVIGIASFIISQSGGFEGLGFAVTSDSIRKLLLENEPFWSGLEGLQLTPEVAALLNLPVQGGILVQSVAKGSPAARLGVIPGSIKATIQGEPLLLGGDVIIEVLGINLTSPDCVLKIRKAMSGIQSQDVFRMKVIRGGKFVVLEETTGFLRSRQ